MNRYYIHEFTAKDAILIDTEKKTWTFYNTNIYGQVYNLEDAEPEKITKQRVNGLIKRLNSRNYNSLKGFVVDRFVYNYIMDQQQQEECKRSVQLRDDLIASGDNFKELLTEMCKHLLTKRDLSSEVDPKYYERTIEKIS